MTKEQIKSLDFGIDPIDNRTPIYVESGLEWIKNNTTLDFDMNNVEEIKALPSCAKLFILKYLDIQNISTGVSSESIEGLSQSFRSDKTTDMIWDIAEELFGDKYLKSRVSFVAATNKWQ